MRRARRAAALAALATAAYATTAEATQDTTTILPGDTAGARIVAADSVDGVEWFPDVAPNSEEEAYLRYLQLAGAVAPYPWSLRGFSPREARKLGSRAGMHPWSGSSRMTKKERLTRVLPVSLELRGNSSFPYGSNDGAIWAGRGLTASAVLGVAMRAGPVSVTLAPMAFIAQNSSFDLLPNGQTGESRFADGTFPTTVDRPQRFGEGSYGRLDPGNSTVRLDVGPLAAGLSTANMAWGPFELYPYTLGTSAPGFVHGFAGTSRPVNIWIGKMHSRVIWGRVEQSEYSPVIGESTYQSTREPGTRRFASGLLAAFTPRGIRGLELGVARFFHSPWPASGIPASYFTKPFENILKNRLQGVTGSSDPGFGTENQVSSAFARWAFPTVGWEMYGEYGRDDHSWDERDFSQEPDHSRSYALGFRKTIRVTPDRLDGITFELINFQLPHLVRGDRGEGSTYAHSVMRQGHTHRGQLLGANVGVGAAAGATVRWDRYAAGGHTSLALHRVVRMERGSFFLDGQQDPRSSDVQYALEAVRTRTFRGVEATAGVTVVRELNRDFSRDATNLSALLRARIPLAR